MQTVMFSRYHEVRPNIYFTNIASQITMPWQVRNRVVVRYGISVSFLGTEGVTSNFSAKIEKIRRQTFETPLTKKTS